MKTKTKRHKPPQKQANKQPKILKPKQKRTTNK